MKNRLLIIAALFVGGASVAAVAACMPDEAAPPAVETAPPAESVTDPAPLPEAPGGLVDPASIAAALETACPVEDSTNCYWDASIAGNGIGTSFVNIEGHIFPLTTILGQ
jgi:hypothetical protein